MDTGTIIFITIMVLCIAIPMAIFDVKKNKKKKQFHKRLLDLAGKNSATITQFESWNNSEIGIDKETGKLFLIGTIEDQEISKTINLSEILKCKYFNSSRTINNKESYQVVVDKIELVFEYRDKSKPDVTLEFYNANFDSLVLNGEVQMAQKWHGIVNDYLGTRKQ